MVLAKFVGFLIVGITLMMFLAGVSCAEEKPEKSGLYKAMGVALVGTSVSDLWSTELGLQSPNVREGNPFMATNTEARIAVKASATALVFLGSDHIHSKGHTRMALWLRIATVAGYGYATAWNLRQAHQ
jgi:hypothetical protein